MKNFRERETGAISRPGRGRLLCGQRSEIQRHPMANNYIVDNVGNVDRAPAVQLSLREAISLATGPGDLISFDVWLTGAIPNLGFDGAPSRWIPQRQGPDHRWRRLAEYPDQRRYPHRSAASFGRRRCHAAQADPGLLNGHWFRRGPAHARLIRRRRPHLLAVGTAPRAPRLCPAGDPVRPFRPHLW